MLKIRVRDPINIYVPRDAKPPLFQSGSSLQKLYPYQFFFKLRSHPPVSSPRPSISQNSKSSCTPSPHQLWIKDTKKLKCEHYNVSK